MLGITSNCIVCDLPEPAPRRLCASCAAILPKIECSCLQCGMPAKSESLSAGICGKCLSKSQPEGMICQSAFHYAPPVDWLIARLKFQADFGAARVLSLLLAQTIVDHYGDVRNTVFIPVPLHWRRLRQRGFNQATQIALHIVQALNCPMHDGLLVRIRNTAQQTGLSSRKARRTNLIRAFEVIDNSLEPDTHIVLIDDVVTTMSTVLAAREALLVKGFRHVDIWSVARAL